MTLLGEGSGTVSPNITWGKEGGGVACVQILHFLNQFKQFLGRKNWHSISKNEHVTSHGGRRVGEWSTSASLKGTQGRVVMK